MHSLASIMYVDRSHSHWQFMILFAMCHCFCLQKRHVKKFVATENQLNKVAEARNLYIYFDMKKEEFGLIDPPKLMRGSLIRQPQLVDLNGEVGVVYDGFISKRGMCIQVWVLKHKELRMHYEIDQWPCVLMMTIMTYIKVIGFWNNDGDILTSTNEGQKFFVYRLKHRVL